MTQTQATLSLSPQCQHKARIIARRLNDAHPSMHAEGLHRLKAEWYTRPPEDFTEFIADVLVRFLPMGKPYYTTRQQRERLEVAVQFVTGLSLDDFVGPYVPRHKRGGKGGGLVRGFPRTAK